MIKDHLVNHTARPIGDVEYYGEPRYAVGLDVFHQIHCLVEYLSLAICWTKCIGTDQRLLTSHVGRIWFGRKSFPRRRMQLTRILIRLYSSLSHSLESLHTITLIIVRLSTTLLTTSKKEFPIKDWRCPSFTRYQLDTWKSDVRRIWGMLFLWCTHSCLVERC